MPLIAASLVPVNSHIIRPPPCRVNGKIVSGFAVAFDVHLCNRAAISFRKIVLIERFNIPSDRAPPGFLFGLLTHHAVEVYHLIFEPFKRFVGDIGEGFVM